MTNYAGLPAGDAIALWRQTHQALAKKYGIDLTNTDPKYLMNATSQMSQDDAYDFTPYNVQTQNPGAFQIFKTGMDTPGNKKQRVILNPLTGEWDTQDKHGVFSHWETWMQLAAGGAIGGVVAAPYIAAALASGAAPAASATALEAGATMGIPGAVTTAGIVAPEALTLGGAAAAAAAPAAAAAVPPAATAGWATPAAMTSGGAAVTKPVVDAVTSPDPYTSQIPSGFEQGPGDFEGTDPYASLIPPGSAKGPSDYDSAIKQAKDAGVSASLLQQLMKSGVGPAGISALTTLLGTHMANSAAGDAAKTQADALKYSTDVQDAAAKRNEAFLRQQSESSYLNTEATRRANYDQWRAREARVSNLGAALGLSARDIPGYVPGVDPRFTSTDTTTSTTTIPGRAAGGPVTANQPYVVGENGPEVVVPQQNATVVPNTGWDPSVFQQIVGRAPSGAETAFYSKSPTWKADVLNAAGGGQPTTPGQIGTGFKLPKTMQPTPTPITMPPGRSPWDEKIPGQESGPFIPTSGPNGQFPTGTGGTYNDLMSALTQNYSALGATPTGPGSGPTDISYFARRIQETGGMTPQNVAYWFGPQGRIAKELAGAVPPEEAAASTPGNAPGGAANTPYVPGSLGDVTTRRSQYWWS